MKGEAVEPRRTARYRAGMGRAVNPKSKLMPVFRVTEEQDKEIRRRAQAAAMTLAEYMRERSLGRSCRPVIGQQKGRGK